MSNSPETERNEQQPSIDSTIERVAEKNGLEISREDIEIGGEQFTLLSITEPGTALPRSLAEEMFHHIQQNVLDEKGSLNRGDCAHVAGDAVKALRNSFEKQGFALGTIGTERMNNPIQFYENKGFKFHVINFVEGKNLAAAVDLTASYTMDMERGVFVVVSSTPEDVGSIMMQLTGVRWEVR